MLASQVHATRSHTTAAAHHGFALPPDAAEVVHLTVRANGHRKRVGSDVVLHFRDVTAGEAAAGVTDAVRTVLDCLRDCDLGTALSVGDSALRSGTVTYDELAARAGTLRGPGVRRIRRRLALLDARAANAFESCCRAILLAAGVTEFEPQVTIRYRGTFVGRVDLAHTRLRIVVECDGFETHGGRDAFVDDLVRHTNLVAAGWRTLRFTWQQVMNHPEWVLQRILDTLAVAAGHQKEEKMA